MLAPNPNAYSSDMPTRGRLLTAAQRDNVRAICTRKCADADARSAADPTLPQWAKARITPCCHAGPLVACESCFEEAKRA